MSQLREIGTVLVLSAGLLWLISSVRNSYGDHRPNETERLLKTLTMAVIGIGLQTIPRSRD